MKQLPYEEGTWFAIPLRSRGYAVGVIARSSQKGKVLFGYFFGPCHDTIPKISDLDNCSPSSSIQQTMFVDRSLISGRWPIIGKKSNWKRDDWPMPGFIRKEFLTDRSWLVKYREDDLSQTESETIITGDPPKLPEDGLDGDGAVEIILTKLLNSSTRKTPSHNEEDEPPPELSDVPINVTVKEYNYDIPFELLYIRENEEFDTEPFERCMYGTSLLINDLELQLDEQAKVRLVAGYAPLTPHEKTENCPNRIQKGSIYFSFDPRRVAAQAHHINENGPWPVYINEKRGWICIGDPEVKDRQLVEFAPDAVATIVNAKIVALWLCPEFIN